MNTITHTDNNTRRYPRTLQEAFSPHTICDIATEPKQMPSHAKSILTAVAIALIALTLAATAISAHAALVCTEVTRPTGEVAQACKNVPEEVRPPHQPVPKPTPFAPPPANKPRPTPTPSKPNPVPALPPIAITPASAIAMASAAQVATLRNQVFEGIAQAAALTPLFPTAVGATTTNAGAATYGGQTAIGLAIAHRPTQNLVFSAGISAATNSGKPLVQISAGFQF